MKDITHCAVCGIEASLKCGGCRNIVYCGKEHQKSHWKKGHKAECKCYEVVSNALLGRHLKATRDIKPGEVILRESPLIYGPKVACAPQCLGCHRTLPPPAHPLHNYYKCSKCGWPMCSAECETSPVHVQECELMALRKFIAKIDYDFANVDASKKEAAYCVILPLRCILLKRQNPQLYQKFSNLEDHLEERIETPLYKVLRANLITFIKTILALDDWDEQEILRVAAILDTNAFDVRQINVGRRVRAIYPAAAMISHDCISNARHTFDDKMQIIFMAKTAIAKGDIIATSYTQPLKSTLIRRQHLLEAKCFNCTCARCCDATEMGIYAGAILCSKCKIGKIISTNPMDNAALWKCEVCEHEIPAKQINWGNAAMLKEIENLNKTSPRALEEFIYRYRETLHEKNTHILQVKYALTQLYGNAPGFRLSEMNDAALKRKIELCQELLDIANVYDAGWSLFRGNLLLDLQEAFVVQAKREFLNELLTREAVKERLEEALSLLKEAVEILKLEPEMQETLKERTELLLKELTQDV